MRRVALLVGLGVALLCSGCSAPRDRCLTSGVVLQWELVELFGARVWRPRFVDCPAGVTCTDAGAPHCDGGSSW